MSNFPDQGDENRPEPLVSYRHAPLGELTIYTISDAELSELEHGSASALILNFVMALIPLGLSFLGTLLTVKIDSTKVFTTFVIVTVVSLLAGVILLVVWLSKRSSTSRVADRIRKRLPPRGEPA